MAQINPTPFMMKNALVKLGDDSYEKAVSSAALTPAGGSTPFQGLTPDAVYTFANSATYTFDLAYAQDWGSEDSLSYFLYTHQGENVAAQFVADNVATGGKTTWDFTVSITAGAVGGAVNAVGVATVSLGVVGIPEPTFTGGA